MKITAVTFYRYSLPLKQPLTLKSTTIDSRDGFLVKVTGESGASGWGGIAPLPGFSRDSLEQVEKELPVVARALKSSTIPDGVQSLDGGFDRWLKGVTNTPSIRFGLESAVLNLVAALKGVTVADLISSDNTSDVMVNALLTGSQPDILTRTDQLLAAGYTTFKLKIGTRPIDEEVQLIAEIGAKIGPERKLRLDANRRMSIEAAFELFEKIEPFDIEYIEEPVANLNQLRILLKDRKRKVPVALDESLLELNPQDLAAPFGIKAVILKPTLLGLERAVAFARVASEKRMLSVISSSFESSVGIGMLVSLAGAFGGKERPAAGLDTLAWFQSDTVEPSVHIAGGKIALATVADIGNRIRPDALHEVPLESA
jgi:O-succinylbenzoate synthase